MRAILTGGTPHEIDAAWLRSRLGGSSAPMPTLYGDEEARPDAQSLTAAAVLMPIVERAEQLMVLFTLRTAHLKAHSGQVSFPGGRVEPLDPSPEATALRETHEEIGLAPGAVEVLGRLSDYHTRTGFRVTPVIGLVASPFELKLDEREVQYVFEVPLSFLLDPANHQRHQREFQGRIVHYYAIPYLQHYIWGATAGMLVNFYRRLTAPAA